MTGQFINWFGHAAGAAVFSLFLALLWSDRSPGRAKAILATSIALLWNLSELVGLALGGLSPALVALESTAFSLLPAVLFDVVISGRPRWAVRTGYLLSLTATAFHLAELAYASHLLHTAGLSVVAAGFVTLAIYAAFRSRQRALSALALLLLALSILHFAEDETHTAWWVELFVHHAAIPLAVVVLLQDYRFVFLDALIRFLANILLALLFASAAVSWNAYSPATALPAFAALLLLFAVTRGRLQVLLTRLVFHRPSAFQPSGDMETALRQYFGAGESTWQPESVVEGPMLLGNGTEAALGVRTPSGSIRLIRLGRRTGGRRYLSEDLELLRQAGDTIRQSELHELVAQAELRALQAQIHPHFLFNALNTLYGIIPKEASGARSTVLNLADIFRYLLKTNQTFVSLEEEINVIKSYLEIEALRLGPRLQVSFLIDPSLHRLQIPLLSLEPLVENAVKHGLANTPNGGSLRITARRLGPAALLEVFDSGPGFDVSKPTEGVGLENVRQRLRLCYGPAADLEVESSSGGTTVRFAVPLSL